MQNHKLELIRCRDVKQLYRMGEEKKITNLFNELSPFLSKYCTAWVSD